MDNFAITAADAVSRRYKSNDPEAIIAQRAIKIKDIQFCEELLGFYTVLLNCEYIGINPNCSKQQRRSALAHELGHAIFDRKHAASGQAFQDTYFYSLSNAKAERRANTFAAELLLSDDDVLKPIGFYEFNADRLQMEASLPTHCSSTYRALKYHELLQDFQYTHTGFATLEEIAQAAGIEKNFVDFKLNILTAKGYQLPAVPELKSNFLKDSIRLASPPPQGSVPIYIWQSWQWTSPPNTLRRTRTVSALLNWIKRASAISSGITSLSLTSG